LVDIGLEPERIQMFNLSAAMANRFVEAANEMAEKIRDIGPNPLKANSFDKDSASKEREI